MSDQSNSKTVTINRASIGVVAGLLLTTAAILWFVAGNQNMWTGACLKVGIVMGAFWLAYPSLSRQGDWGKASWGTAFVVLAAALVMTGRRVHFGIVLAILVGFVLATSIFRPRSKRNSR